MTMGIYNVKKGDTLSELAQRFNTTVENLVKLNNIKDPNSIFIGQAIKFEQDKCESWQDLDGDKKVSWQDFQGCSRYGIFLDKITSYIGKQWDEQIAGKIQDLYKQYVSNPKEAVIQNLVVNGTQVSYDANSNFYRNNIASDFAVYSVNDIGKSTDISIRAAFGNDVDARDRKVADFLKKTLGDNLDNTSKILENEGKYSIKTVRLEGTDLYKSFVSNDVNPDMFTTEKFGKYEDDVFKPNFAGKVQLPALEISPKGVKYFTLQTRDGQSLYFDEAGKKVDSLEDLEQKDVKYTAPDIPELKPAQTVPVEAQFSVREGYNSAKLNIGNVYINGQLQADNKF